mmetsp:Transcript_32864/g.76759  ORF Transcript_32864/g.76759 Transcript_32864/m.76759 type:complete len:268 (-) Transcript_32864:11-814(-)
MQCPECRESHPARCGWKVYVEAKCPVCWDYDRPFIIFPCGHGVCVQHFQDLGGQLQDCGLSQSVPSEAVRYTDTDGDEIAFVVNALGGLDYEVNGRPKVRGLTSLSLSGCTLHLDGISAGSWGSQRRTTLPASQAAVARQALDLFHACTRASDSARASGVDSEPSEALDFVDTDGDRIAFIVNASGRMDYIVNQRVKVRNLSRLSIRHRTIHLDGESAGTWSSSRGTGLHSAACREHVCTRSLKMGKPYPVRLKKPQRTGRTKVLIP